MRPSDRIALKALIFPTVLTGILYWLIPIMAWWAYAGFFVIAFAAGYSADMQHAARKRIIDGEKQG